MTDCIFCRIVKGEAPSSRIYEDDLVLSFLDINPISRGHSLVIPKKHYVSLFEISPEELEACMAVCQKVAKAVYRGVGASGLNLIQNNFRSAGQVVDHIHFHLIPRHERDGFHIPWPAKPYPTGEIGKVLGKIRAEL